MRDRVLKVTDDRAVQGSASEPSVPDVRRAQPEWYRRGDRPARAQSTTTSGSCCQPRFRTLTVVKAYRLLHAIFETVVGDHRIISRNPRRIQGAGQEASDEREIVPLSVVLELAETVPVRYRALILLATFADMRTVAFPEEIAPEIRWHLERFTEPGSGDSSLSHR